MLEYSISIINGSTRHLNQTSETQMVQNIEYFQFYDKNQKILLVILFLKIIDFNILTFFLLISSCSQTDLIIFFRY